jgi:hypothetical protein
VWVAIGVLAGLAVAGVVAWVGLTRPEWLPMNPAAIGPNTVQTVEPLPVPASAEIWLARARNYYEDGRLHDALTSLQAIAPTDPRKADADELKAAIQSRLLEAARKSPAPSQ